MVYKWAKLITLRQQSVLALITVGKALYTSPNKRNECVVEGQLDYSISLG